MKWLRSIRLKLAVMSTILLMVALFAQSAVTTVRLYKQERQQLISLAESQTAISVNPIVDTYLKYKDALGLELTRSMRTIAAQLPALDHFELIDTQGRVAFDSRSLKHSVVLEPITNTVVLDRIQSNRASTLITAEGHTFIQPHFDSTGTHDYSIRSFVNFSSLASMNRSNITQLIVTMLLLLPLVFFLSLWLTSQLILRPINEIRSTSNAIAGGDFDTSIKTKSKDEFHLLAENINHMTETLIERVNSLEEEKAWKNEFLVLASHNLRTPLTVIMSSVATLKKDSKISQESMKFVDYIYTRGKELHSLIENMLSISMLKAGKLQRQNEPFDLIPLAQNALSGFEPRSKDKNVTMELETKSKHAIVSGDEGQILQVLDNLLDNALKFTPEKGKITLTIDDSKQDIFVTVKDSGEGIGQDMINKLFQSFHRGANPMSIDEKGSGLGLYFVKLAVESHGGEVSIKSNAGHGTQVSFHLPKHAT
ncbi:MAG TPA: HAMP domain-containing sensor histidine kinase [Patescibacteria group bacterium]